MLLNGKILADNTELYINQLGEYHQALTCVTDNINCCVKSISHNFKAEFHLPNGQRINRSQISHLYVMRGFRVILLNYYKGGQITRRGQYCCIISNAQGVVKSHCIILK